MFKKVFTPAASAVSLATLSSSVFAAEGSAAWDYSSLTSSVDFSSIGTGVLSVAAAMAVVYAGIKGAQIVLGFLRR